VNGGGGDAGGRGGGCVVVAVFVDGGFDIGSLGRAFRSH